MPRHALIVYNPTASSMGQPDLMLGRIAHELCERADFMVHVFATHPGKSPHDLVPLLKPIVDVVIAAGGDGTVGFVLGALAQARSEIPAAIIPLGTANVLAHNLRLIGAGSPISRAVDTILNGRRMRIDLGQMNGEYFAVAAGAGPMPEAFIVPRRETKTRFRIFAYAGAMIKTIAIPPVVFKIFTDSECFQVPASGIFVCNVEDFGLGKAADLSDLTDGHLNLIIVNPTCFKDYVELGFRYAAGHVNGDVPVYVRRVKQARIEVVTNWSRPSTFQRLAYKVRRWLEGDSLSLPPRHGQIAAMLDGEERGSTPMDIKVIPQAVNVLCPPEVQDTDLQGQLSLFSRSGESFLPLPTRAIH